MADTTAKPPPSGTPPPVKPVKYMFDHPFANGHVVAAEWVCPLCRSVVRG